MASKCSICRRVWRACEVAGGADDAVVRAARLSAARALVQVAGVARVAAHHARRAPGRRHGQARHHLLQPARVLQHAQPRDLHVPRAEQEAGAQARRPLRSHQLRPLVLQQQVPAQRQRRQDRAHVEFGERRAPEHFQVSLISSHLISSRLVSSSCL